MPSTRCSEAPRDGIVLRLEYDRFYPVRDWNTALSLLRMLVGDGTLFYAEDARLLEYRGGVVVRESRL